MTPDESPVDRPSNWRDRKRPPPPPDDAAGTVIPPLVSPKTTPSARWEYQWEDSLNPIGPAQIEPPLAARIVAELASASARDAPLVIFVRGELGIGKSTLASILSAELEGRSKADDLAVAVRNALGTCLVAEAQDLESPTEFASRVNRAIVGRSYAVLLARPGAMDDAARALHTRSGAQVTMRPFDPASPAFRECIGVIAARIGLADVARDVLFERASRLPKAVRTPFYFEQIATIVSAGTRAQLPRPDASALELFRYSLERKVGGQRRVAQLTECALGKIPADSVIPIPGILDASGFVHDGYRTILLAVVPIVEPNDLEEVLRAPNSVDALRLVLDHLASSGTSLADDANLIARLEAFAIADVAPPGIPYWIYLQGLVAATFQRIKDGGVAHVVRERCMRLISGPSGDGNIVRDTDSWDVSDALSLVGDPRLRRARHAEYAPNCGYFTSIAGIVTRVGSDNIPSRADDAKPVLPYRPTDVTVGPLWVANFLVTNELFSEFWRDPDAERHYKATGRQWVRGDPDLMTEIESSFSIAARRCFWKEIHFDQAVELGSSTDGDAVPMLKLAQMRALRQGRVSLWNPTDADARFSAAGNPVVGVTWWEAAAFCEWWTETKLHPAFPRLAYAALLTDWEWEAIRRLYYEPPNSPDLAEYPTGRFPAHLREATGRARARGRVTNVMRPLHVGMAPRPTGDGPFDLVGNVWEWTRSRVFGRIVEASETHPGYGPTAWNDGDPAAERTPCSAGRDDTSNEKDLSYRAVRGGSFFSTDEQAAWHPSYRLCDPPFSSYFDLGFRIAIYPGGH